MLRFPDGVRDRIAEAAKANNRSMNAEIVARIERSLTVPELSEQLILAMGIMAMATKQLAASIDPASLPEEKRKFIALLEQAATQVLGELPKKENPSPES